MIYEPNEVDVSVLGTLEQLVTQFYFGSNHSSPIVLQQVAHIPVSVQDCLVEWRPALTVNAVDFQPF